VAECSAHLTLITETVAGDMSSIADLHEQCTEVRSDETVLQFSKTIAQCILDQSGKGKTNIGGKKAVTVLLPFSSTDFCEAGFSAIITKTKL
jgi:hypothetical protein